LFWSCMIHLIHFWSVLLILWFSSRKICLWYLSKDMRTILQTYI